MIRKRRNRLAARRILLIGSALGAGALLPVLPVSHRPFVYHPSANLLPYDKAVREIRTLIAGSPPNIRPECAVQLLEHGHPTKQVFVLMHGLSNCPAQFAEFGRLLFERGHNVVIPRIPYHGEQDRLTTDWARLKAEDMLDAGNQAVDLARNLGDKIAAAGLSINGATVAWMAQNRSDLDRAVLLAPFLAPAGLPDWTLTPVERLLLRLPNMFFWWNSKLKENLQGPPYVYPRFPTRVMAETMRLGGAVLRESRSQSPRSASILVVTSASDTAANNRVTSELVANWQRLRQTGIETFEFPAADKVPHDFIDPNQPNQKTALVYPKIIELLEK
jgi:alpha-beta hydrolase superfamily lysophospholipase